MRAVLLYFLLFTVFVVNAQTGFFKKFNAENGMLTHNSVETIVRDNHGYVWVGTNYGLNRLDGYQTINYISNPGDSLSISSNFIKTLFVDRDGNLWIGTIGGGLNKLIRKTNSFQRFLPNATKNSISGINISAINQDDEGNIWIGIIGKGVDKLNPKTGVFTHYSFDNIHHLKQRFSNVKSLHPDSYGNIWVGFDFDRNGIYKINPQTGNITFHGMPPEENKKFDVGAVTAIGELSDGTLLFSIWNSMLFKLHPLKDEHIVFWKGPAAFEGSQITSLVVDKKDNVWIGTWEKGIYKIDALTGQVKNFSSNPSNPEGISSNAVKCLHVENNNLWIGFREQGVNLLNTGNKMFKTLPTTTNAGYSEKEIDAHCITADNKGNLWVGTRGQGLWKYNLKQGIIKNYNSTNSNFKNDNILSVLYSKTDELLWLGSDGDFLATFDPKTEKARFIEHHEGDWSSVYCLEETNNYIWCGTWGSGLKKLDKKTRTYSTIHFDKDDQYRNSIFDIDKSGNNFWIANVGMGLIRYNIESGSYEVFNHSNLEGYPKENPNCIFIDTDTSIWIATAGAGIIHFYPETKKFEVFNTTNGLSSNVVQALVAEPGSGNIWCSTNSGVTLFNKKTKESKTFYKHNGLADNNTNISSILASSSEGKIYFGTMKGVSYCDTGKILYDSMVRDVVINRLDVLGKEVIPGHEDIIKATIDQSDKITLKPKHKFFTVYFSSMEFNPSFKSAYYYKLDGFNNEWLKTSYNKNFAQYTNLDPGNYTLRIKASNRDGIVSNHETTLSIHVKPAFWQTIIFNIGVLIILILVVVLIVYQRYHSLLKSQLELEMKVSDRTSEIQFQKEEIERQKHELEMANKTKDKFVSIIGHDLKNPMSSIDQLIELLLIQDADIDDKTRKIYLENLKKLSDKTLNLLDDLMVWAQSQANQIKIKKTKLNISEIIDDVVELCNPIARKKNIEIVSTQKKNHYVDADKNTVTTVLRNLITNALKFSFEKGKVFIHVAEDIAEIIIRVEDHGTGMTETTLKKLFKVENIISKEGTKGETGTGLGLILCQEFVHLNGGRIWAESKPGEGSTFVFTLEKAD
ncbi:MAG: hypothetical protein K9H26_01850 [Prolixibacteraceae bacterium]|nr:hypothetical protein [Prolixibacteraceae bacterium]